MRYCSQCKRVTAGDPLYCNHCGATYDAKLCPARHLNPRNAEVCAQCGSRDLSTPAPRLALWLRPVIFVLVLLPGFCWRCCWYWSPRPSCSRSPPMVRSKADLVALLLLLAILWWIYIHLPKFTQKALRSLWQGQKKDKH